MQEHGDALVVLELAEEGETLLVHAMRALVLAGQPERAREAAKRASPQPLRKLARGGQQLVETPGALERVGRDPEVLEQHHQLGGAHTVAGRRGPVDRGAEVLLVAQESARPVAVARLRGGVLGLGEGQVEVEVP